MLERGAAFCRDNHVACPRRGMMREANARAVARKANRLLSRRSRQWRPRIA
jgi:hypothetical protein